MRQFPVLFSAVAFAVAFMIAPADAQLAGGYREANVKSKEVIAAAEFAVKEHAAKEKVKLELAEIVKASTQVVAGTNFKLVLKVTHDGAEREAHAVVWHKVDKNRTYQLTSWAWQDVKKAEPK